MVMNIKDETNNVYGKLKVLRISDKNTQPKSWVCECECGTITEVYGPNLRRGTTKSCGCIRDKNDSHFLFDGYEDLSGAYWSIIKCRCNLKKIELSITIEEAWNLFLKQDKKCKLSNLDIILVKSYKKDRNIQTASLDRIDSSKGYIEGNVQWVHKDINKMKNEFSQENFIKYCKLVSNNF